MQPGGKGTKQIAANKKAYHDYFILDRYEAGIELTGTEVKSIRAGALNLKDCYCRVKNGELWVHGMHISPYKQGSYFNVDPDRSRRLLMHKREIVRLGSKATLEGLALIPLSLYFKDSRVKVELGLCKGKKLYDKRQDAADKSARREIDRKLKEVNQ